MSNSHVQSAKAIAEDIAHLRCVPDDWRLQISDLAAWPFSTFCAKPPGWGIVGQTDRLQHPTINKEGKMAELHRSGCSSRRQFIAGLAGLGARVLLSGGKSSAQVAAGNARRIDVHHHFGSPAWVKMVN